MADFIPTQDGNGNPRFFYEFTEEEYNLVEKALSGFKSNDPAKYKDPFDIVPADLANKEPFMENGMVYKEVVLKYKKVLRHALEAFKETNKNKVEQGRNVKLAEKILNELNTADKNPIL